MTAALVETYRGTIYPWQCDHMGHMNVMWYVGKFDEATWQFFSMLGLTPAWLLTRPVPTISCRRCRARCGCQA